MCKDSREIQPDKQAEINDCKLNTGNGVKDRENRKELKKDSVQSHRERERERERERGGAER